MKSLECGMTSLEQVQPEHCEPTQGSHSLIMLLMGDPLKFLVKNQGNGKTESPTTELPVAVL